jgi:hypothetical protein
VREVKQALYERSVVETWVEDEAADFRRAREARRKKVWCPHGGHSECMMRGKRGGSSEPGKCDECGKCGECRATAATAASVVSVPERGERDCGK